MTAAASAEPLRVLLAVGDRTAEQRLVHELAEHGLVVVGRALDAPGLLEAASGPSIDAALVSADLHRLDEPTLIALRERRVPVVVLARDATDTARFRELTLVLPARSSAGAVAAALREAGALGGSAPAFSPAPSEPADVARQPVLPEASGVVFAVTSGKGAPGKTTVAVALAAELGRVGLDVVLVDADLRGGNVAAYLDLDPRRGIVGVAASSGPLSERLEAELQPGPGCAVLGGVERPELATALPAELVGAAIATLRTRFARVVVDLGAPAEPAALRAADEIIVVSGADLVSIWNARTGLAQLRQAAPSAPVCLLVNRYEGREHYVPDEVGRALGVPALGAVREDRKAARRAIAKQIPLSEARGHAAGDLRAIAASLQEIGVGSRVTAPSAGGIAGRLAVER